MSHRSKYLLESRDTSSGFGLVEALVASVILSIAVIQAMNLFLASMKATSKAQLRDGINAAINEDLEQVRHEIANWSSSTTSDGQLAYSPDATACANGSLGQALLSAKATQLPANKSLNFSNAPKKLWGVTVNRRISVAPENTNLIQISYSTTTTSPVIIKQSTILATPAQGWCP